MTRKSIVTDHIAVACDVCGRTLLRGEHSDVYLASGSPRQVCELCTARAAHEGWVRAGAAPAPTGRRGRSEARRSLLGRLRARRARAPRDGAEADLEPFEARAPVTAPAPVYDDAAPAPAYEGAWEPVYDDAEPSAPAPVPDPAPPAPTRPPVSAQPAAPPAHRNVRAVPSDAVAKVARALEVFNASQHPRTVAGVARSLGAPLVCARPSDAVAGIVEVVVAWELCWYRYEIDLAEGITGVRVADRGDETAELSPEEQLANAVADERGELALAEA